MNLFSAIPLTGTNYEELAAGAQAYLRFLEEVPDIEKRRVHFKSQFHRGSADGYCDVRNREGKDPKEYFHFAPRLELQRAYREVKERYEAAAAFFTIAAKIYTAAEHMAEKVFRDELPWCYERCFDHDGTLISSQLRFLCYTPTKVALRAKGHYDKGHASIPLAESSAGLRVGCCREHAMTPVRHNDGTAIFMPAQLLWEDSGGRIIPAWHDVAPEDGTPNISPRCARWAIVLFINDKDGRYPEWDATHTPLPVHKRIAA